MINKEVTSILEGLNKLTELHLPLNIKASYTLAKNKRALADIASIVEEKKIEIYRKWGTPNDDHTITVPNEKLEDMQKDLDELMAIDNEVQITKLKIEDFGEAEIPFEIMELLLPIMDE